MLFYGKKFDRRERTADDEARAHVRFRQLDILWFNTGTLCNIECGHCYIESSPVNDRLVYMRSDEVARFLDEIAEDHLPTKQIGFTGGEPFMNPDMVAILDETLGRGFDVLMLTNAMQPMMRKHIQEGLMRLREKYGAQPLVMRVSLDHYTRALHDQERGAGSWEKTIAGLVWLSRAGFRIHIAGRRFSSESEDELRGSYLSLFSRAGITLDDDPGALVIFPEMDDTADVPEITEKCWDTLSVNPDSMMCASSRMIVKRRGAERPVIVSCTLLPYDRRFEMGADLKQASAPVWLNHPHCARFCVLGGGSCAS